MISCKNIHKYYGDLHVLKGVSLDIQKGEIVSIVGESGAGKSTLLQIMGTLDKPSILEKVTTSIHLGDKDLTQLPDHQLSKIRNTEIGFIFQFHQLLPEFTALENVILPGLIAHKNRKELEQKAEELLQFLQVWERKTHKPSELSGGEQQRVAVARALINDPNLILADEPSGNLDSKNADELHHLFFKLRDKFQQTFVIVTHNPTLADMADRKLTLKDGDFAT